MKKHFLLLTIFTLGFVNAQSTIFEENFNNEDSLVEWTKLDIDNDGLEWTYYSDANPFGSCIGSLSNMVFLPMNVDDAIVSPVINLPDVNNLNLTFKLANINNELFEQHYSVYVINESDNFIGTEKPIFSETINSDYSEQYKTINLDLTEFKDRKVKLVFRHHNTDSKNSFMLLLDDILVTSSNLGISNINKKSILVYQENDLVKISGLKDVKKVKVFDITGKLVSEVNQSEANISSLPKGIYIVNFYSGDNVISRKIVKK